MKHIEGVNRIYEQQLLDS